MTDLILQKENFNEMKKAAKRALHKLDAEKQCVLPLETFFQTLSAHNIKLSEKGRAQSVHDFADKNGQIKAVRGQVECGGLYCEYSLDRPTISGLPAAGFSACPPPACQTAVAPACVLRTATTCLGAAAMVLLAVPGGGGGDPG